MALKVVEALLAKAVVTPKSVNIARKSAVIRPHEAGGSTAHDTLDHAVMIGVDSPSVLHLFIGC